MSESREQLNGQPGDTGSVEKIKPKCLLVDDEEGITTFFKSFFDGSDNFVAVECHTVEDALNAIRANSPKVLFLDHNFTRGGTEGLEIADRAREIIPDIEIYSTTSHGHLSEYKKRGIKHIGKNDFRKLRDVISGEQTL